MNNTGIKFYYVLAISMVSAMGGLLFGYDWVVIGGAKPFYEVFFDISANPAQQGWAMSSALAGCLLGALLSGLLSDRYGRKRLLILSAALFIISAVGTGATNHYDGFILFRIIGGLGIGLASNLSPMYIAEVTPGKYRGRFVSINQLTIVIGILAAQLVNWMIADKVNQNDASSILQSWNGQMGWRWMFWAENVPALLFFILMWFLPESPRWLAKQNKHEKSLHILDKIGGAVYARQELKEIEKTLKNAGKKVNLKMLLEPRASKLIIIGVVLAVFQQWCGINVIFNYAQEVFAAAGYGISDILFNIVITGSVNLVFTLVAMRVVDRWGRKALMQFGAAGLAGIYAVMGLLFFLNIQGWPLLVLVVMAIACYAMSLAPVTWVLLSEIFPNKFRGVAMAISTTALWAASFILTYTFPLFNDALKASGTFWLYGIICLAGWVFIRSRLVETKGKSLEEIEHMLFEEHSTFIS